ncbi:activating signal cointegrator 1 complex subunit 2-like [Melanaphis sacchari]|uniref:activating signal cointegrator 1 complex subunit 2-like n=1 Tax=Melanaphis sacchari TaxID=742174 RepID=UPI000DC156D4|nr:activating signal cointegrator 1 complex subunit 2-like [Melanaphis sacchari]
MAIEDEKLAIKRQFLGYIHPLKSITNDLDQKECWIEQMKYLILDFKTLLNLSFKEFWSTVVFNKQATMGLCTFFQEGAPPHLMDQLPQDDDMLIIYHEINHFAYELFKRLTTSTENEENYMSPHHMWSLLYNNNIISITMLFDICSIYGQSHKKQLEIIFKELFTCEKLYEEKLKHLIKLTIKCLKEFQDKIELDMSCNDDIICQRNKTSTNIEETNLCMIEDDINFLLDTSYSISNFLEIYPMASIFFYQDKLHLKIASFYHNIKPLVYKKVIAINKLEKFQEKLHASRTLFIKTVRQCLIPITTQITNGSENAIEEYLDVIIELLVYDEFVNDFIVAYNLIDDIKEYQQLNKKIDSIKYDYLLKSLELINKPYAELKENELQEQQLEIQTNSTNMENAIFQSLINNVKDILPHLKDGFILKCLRYYNMDSEKVINTVLENNLPSELAQYNSNLSSMSEYENNATDYDPTINGCMKLENLCLLDDKSFRNEMRPFYEKYNLTEMTSSELKSYYNDENETSRELEYALPEPEDENKKRRPDVIPRVLIEKKAITECIQEESSDDESQQLLNFEPFCENPEDVRKQKAKRYALKQSDKFNQSKPKVASSVSATSSKSNDELNRQRKNEKKAFSGNHNRRNAARNKQSKGMF